MIYLCHYLVSVDVDAANVGPWKKLAKRRGAVVKVWHPTPLVPENPYSVSLQIKELLPLISNKTRLVAFTACSNILGSIVPVKEVVQAIRADAQAKGSRKVEISVDCVAYAPHRPIDVQDWDVDFCVFSYYKVHSIPAPSCPITKPALTSLEDLRTSSLCPLCPCLCAPAIGYFSRSSFPSSRTHFLQTSAWWSWIRACLCNHRSFSIPSFPHACQQPSSYLGRHSTT